MIVNKKPLVFATHARLLQPSLLPGHRERVSDYTQRYLRGESNLRHPMIALRHRLLEYSVKPTMDIESARMCDVEMGYAVARSNWQTMIPKSIAGGIVAFGTVVGVMTAIPFIVGSFYPDIPIPTNLVWVTGGVGVYVGICAGGIVGLKMIKESSIGLLDANLRLLVNNMGMEIGRRIGGAVTMALELGTPMQTPTSGAGKTNWR